MDPNENKLPDNTPAAVSPEPATVQPAADQTSQTEVALPQLSEQIAPSAPAPQTFQPDVQPPVSTAAAPQTDKTDNQPTTAGGPGTLSSGALMPTESFSPGGSASSTAVSNDPVPAAQTMPQPGASASPVVMPAAGSSLSPSAVVTDAAVIQSTPTVGGSDNGGNFFSRRKKILIPAIVVVLLLVAAGGVFGLYLPSRPENVWKTGMDRSGQALETIISDATSKEQLDAVKMFDISGDVNIKAENQGNFSGTISSKIDASSSDSAFTMSTKVDSGEKFDLGAKVLTVLDEKSQYPDIYFQLSGLRSLGLDAFVPGISDYDGKWIVVGSDYLKSLAKLDTDTSDKSHATPQDATDAVLAVTKVSREYILTADTGKAVLVNEGYVGKETVEGVDSYHYKVGFNKDHAADYCQALGDTVAGTAVFKKEVAKADQADSKKDFIKSCQDSVKDIPSDAKFDMWIDGHYKLIHKIRISDPDNQKSYVDIGQTYKGDDNLNLFLNAHDPEEKTDVSVTAKIDTKTYASSASMTFKNTSSDDPMTGTAHLTVKPSTGHVKVTRPAGALPLQSVLERFGIPTGPSTSDASTLSNLDVTEN